MSFLFRDEVKSLMEIILDLKNKSTKIVGLIQDILQNESSMDLLDKVDAYLTLINETTNSIS